MPIINSVTLPPESTVLYPNDIIALSPGDKEYLILPFKYPGNGLPFISMSVYKRPPKIVSMP